LSGLSIHEEKERAEKILDDLFPDTLKDIYFTEKQILEALRKMARAAQFPEGTAAFLKHKDKTGGQIERLQPVAAFRVAFRRPRANGGCSSGFV
jgi:ferritin-like metal-binding protein YciE